MTWLNSKQLHAPISERTLLFKAEKKVSVRERGKKKEDWNINLGRLAAAGKGEVKVIS